MAGESAANGYLRGVATFIVVVLTIACLYWARSVLMPVALSILLTFILAPVVNRVQQVGLWRAPAVIVVVSIVGLLSLGAVWVISVQIAGLVSDLPNYQDNIAQKVSDAS